MAACRFVLALLLGVPIGLLAAVRKAAGSDELASSFGAVGSAFPSFYLGILLIWVFGVCLRSVSDDGLRAPVGRLLGRPAPPGAAGHHAGSYYTGLIVLITRASLIEVMNQPFIEAVRARGEPAGG